jgi:hypothetical protein
LQDPSSDPIMRRLYQTNRIATAHASGKAGLWDPNYSTTLEGVRHGDPFAFVWRRLPPGTNPRINRDRYDDARLLDGISALRRYGVPIYYVHLPIHPEIKENAYLPTSHKAALLRDLEHILGEPVLRDLSYIEVAAADVDRIRINPQDGAHPSQFGMQVYAKSLVRMLEEIGALDKWTGH